MKKLIFKSSIILTLYTIFNLYFAVFNWRIFTAKLNIDLGFAVLEFPPFVLLFLAGFILMAILSWINYNLRLRNLINNLEKGAEIGNIKNKLIEKQFMDLLYDEKTLSVLSDKLGIKELSSRNELLGRQISDLGQKLSIEKNNS